MKKHNYSAGPCVLPQEVFQEASKAVLDFNGIGMSILEISHRSKEFIAVMDEACDLALELLNLKDKGYKAMFLQGGASLQFLMVPYNLLKEGGKAAYVNTGAWSGKAMKEAKLLGEVKEIASSKQANFNYIPKDYVVPSDVDYVHLTSNNTIFGTQIKEFPKTSVPMVCDMSSDIFSRVIDFTQFDLIYAGAQKNLGPAGATLVVIKEDLIGQSERTIPAFLDYKTHLEAESMYNTPPVYAVYVSLLNLRHMKKLGGVAAMQKRNQEKAALLYNEIDRNPLFEGTAAVEDRSPMNATFLLKDETLKETFDKMVKEANISGINGHRSVGGYRASMYNALSIESVQALVDCMVALENKIK